MASDVRFNSRSTQLTATDGFDRLIGNNYRIENRDAVESFCHTTPLPLHRGIFGDHRVVQHEKLRLPASTRINEDRAEKLLLYSVEANSVTLAGHPCLLYNLCERIVLMETRAINVVKFL
jgi:hypothetical protein